MVKISKLEIENVKRVRAVSFEPNENGLTVIGGNNGQGKTSVLDAIAWALGGEKYRPSKAQNSDSVTPPKLHIELSNGLIVERSGKNSDLKVIDPSGKKAGQTLLNSFIEELALNLPKFMNSSSKDKAKTLLEIIGVGPELSKLEMEENKLFQDRLITGRMVDQKKGYLGEMPFYKEAPEEPISVAELIHQQQEILARNGDNARKRENVRMIDQRLSLAKMELERLQAQLTEKESEVRKLTDDSMIAHSDATNLVDESTEEIEKSISNIEEINRKVSANIKHKEAEKEMLDLDNKYTNLTEKINDVRQKKMDLLNNANLPLPGLSIEAQELTYNGQKWDNMSGSEQLKVATAIVSKLKPECQFVLMDKLEQMDIPTMNEFSKWLEEHNLQAIATRVSTGDECEIIISDGFSTSDIAEHKQIESKPEPTGWGGAWK